MRNKIFFIKHPVWLVLLFLLLISLSASAQQGLYVAPFFKGEYNQDPNAVVVIIKGKKLEPYHLSLFHSIEIKDSPRNIDRIEKAVLADGKHAENSEEVKDGTRTVACYYQLPPAGKAGKGPNRFILFRRSGQGSGTLIYLEGHTELEQLIKIFIHKKK